MFIGREKELAHLKRDWDSGRFRMPVVYGRRRIGKTSILREFSRDKNALFLSADIDRELNVQNLRAIMQKKDIKPMHDDLPNLVRQIFREAKTRRLLFVVDEFPWLVDSCPPLTSVIQHAIDEGKDELKLMFVICGSSISYMRWKVLGYQSPLFGRNTSELRIEPFTLFESMRFLPGTPFRDLCEIYGMTDGTPSYLEIMEDGCGLRGNFLGAFPDQHSYLFNEAFNLLKIELEDPALYSHLLSLLAKGPVKMREIGDKMESMEISRRQAQEMVADLEEIMIVKGESPLGGDIRKNTLYEIRDLYFRFWHRFMPVVRRAISNGMAEQACDYVIKSYPQYMGAVFEKICGQWLVREMARGTLPMSGLSDIGRWWGTNPATKSQEEIDIVIRDLEGRHMFCECKWQNERVGTDVFSDLKRKSLLVSGRKDSAFMVFAKSGFTPECAAMAKKAGARLIDLVDLEGKNAKKRKVADSSLKFR